ncbi:TetR family transcriptional regulator C-terminal domain-containing protein [Paracoccus sp. DMF-8]|uniref:TetR family transcriptional regulator C-terminal domain-containing protein n=1 Tax=Paracoccus sp. DMF-8 TaxID=3019445 RepID=UPI0023E88A67|nr:TetR family transcriptional regulator C-terminal domain-containing protein [Paracoccus sp. DMF-8]MDF3606437.1 TetR family transcriptional regulator C-terminal domain-containing protein [Paracoccus sp. DMF-8]
MTAAPRQGSRIQQKNRRVILQAALSEFSTRGFNGTTIDRIAETASLSKPNVLYYFPSKEAIHLQLLETHLDLWLDPLRALSATGEPREQIMGYMRRKLDMSRNYPQESRLFANEVLQGAPHLERIMAGGLHDLVAEKAAIIADWIAQGRIAAVDPHHLIISIWALTQHYADFEVQVRAVLGQTRDPFAEAERFLDHLYSRMLAL